MIRPDPEAASPDDACASSLSVFGNNKKNILILSVIILFYWYWAGKPQFLFEIAAASGSTKVAKCNASSVGEQKGEISSSALFYPSDQGTSPSENDIDPKTAVVHMGIHKKGSSLIQLQSRNFAHLLKLDGYEMPWLVNKEQNSRNFTGDTSAENQVNFATCFIPPSGFIAKYPCAPSGTRAMFPCDPDLLLHGLSVKNGLFISAETFDKIDYEGVNRLAEYLDMHWSKIIIVVFYRRYYDW